MDYFKTLEEMPNKIGQKNIFLADFMGRHGKENKYLWWVNVPGVKWVTVDQMEFHTNWNWLHAVMDKIGTISKKGWITDAQFVINSQEVRVNSGRWHHEWLSHVPFGDDEDAQVSTQIEATWIACYDFIIWYNAQKKEDLL